MTTIISNGNSAKIYIDGEESTIDLSSLDIGSPLKPYRSVINLNDTGYANKCNYDYFKIWQDR